MVDRSDNLIYRPPHREADSRAAAAIRSVGLSKGMPLPVFLTVESSIHQSGTRVLCRGVKIARARKHEKPIQGNRVAEMTETFTDSTNHDSWRLQVTGLVESQDAMEQTLGDAFDQLESLRRDLLRERHRLDQEQAELENDRGALEQSRQSAHSTDEAHQHEIEQLRGELAEARVALSIARESAGQEANQAEDTLSDHREEFDRLQAELADERVSRESTRAELLSLQPAVQEYAALKAEHTAVEIELETVRDRAAGLSDEVSVLRKEIVEQQAVAANDITRLQNQINSIEAPTERPEVARPAAPASPENQPEEAVVGSVMAQFAMLRNQRVSRQGKSHPER